MSESMKVEDISVDDLEESPWNPNEMSDNEFNRLAEELQENGFIDPIQVVPLDTGKYRILGGHHRYKAAKAIGIEKIPAVILSDVKWSDEENQKFVNVRLNMLRGKLNPEKFLKLYKEMADKYGDENLQRLMGFVDSDVWTKLVGSVRDAMAKSGLPDEMMKKFDETKEEIKTVDDLAGILNRLFTDFGSTLPVGYMVFTFGGKDNLYVKMKSELKDKMWKIKDKCFEEKVHISDLLQQVIDADRINEVIGSLPKVQPDEEKQVNDAASS